MGGGGGRYTYWDLTPPMPLIPDYHYRASQVGGGIKGQPSCMHPLPHACAPSLVHTPLPHACTPSLVHAPPPSCMRPLPLACAPSLMHAPPHPHSASHACAPPPPPFLAWPAQHVLKHYEGELRRYRSAFRSDGRDGTLRVLFILRKAGSMKLRLLLNYKEVGAVGCRGRGRGWFVCGGGWRANRGAAGCRAGAVRVWVGVGVGGGGGGGQVGMGKDRF